MEVVGQIKCLKNIYDLLALCCEVTMLYTDYDYNSGGPLKYTGELQDVFSQYDVECKKGYKKHAFEHLKKGIEEFLGREANVDRLFAIALVIDDRIEPRLAERSGTGEEFIEYEGLNRQYTDQVLVTPKKVNSFFDEVQSRKDENGYAPFREPRESSIEDIDYQIKNYSVRYKKSFEEHPVRFFRASRDSLLYSHFSGHMQLSIGMVPLTHVHIKDIFEIECENGNFEIHGMKSSPKDLNKRYERTWEGLAGRTLDCLILPEMLMTEEILECLRSSPGPEAYLTVNGSVWKNCTNYSILTDVNGKEIFHYFKKALFKYKKDGKEYLEHLYSKKNKGYTVLEIENFGRIGIAICKDLLKPDVRTMYKRLNINLLFVPAYSPSMDMHSEACELAEQLGCVVIMVNSCGAMEKKGGEIGYVCMPAKQGNERSSLMKKISCGACEANCRNGCSGVFLELYFDKMVLHEDKLSFGIRNELLDAGRETQNEN
jgi:hypothetical protein